jgi:hypothetical protein
MRRKNMKAFRIMSKISFKDRERNIPSFSNTVTQLSIGGEIKFSKSAYKVVTLLRSRKEGSSNRL